ncbi:MULTISPECIES: hypothetical protein [unclassified Streptomyces]|uniref:hypothetical protein n=1 Tax=unclassified Streptomyces TaxID=2593676 RepID=UPI0036E98C89
MADESTFNADPARIMAGGGATDEVGTETRRAAEGFADKTSWDVQDPPWGNDSYGHQYAQNYIPFHSQLRDAIRTLGNAVHAAADLTMNSGKSFQKTQDDALGHINGLKPQSHARP